MLHIRVRSTRNGSREPEPLTDVALSLSGGFDDGPVCPFSFSGERVEGTGDALAALLQHVDVLHGRAQVLVAQELLDGAHVGAVLEEMRGKPTGGTFTEQSGVNEWRSV